MQPGAPGRSSSVSERRPRRGGGGGGDGGGAAGRRHQTEPSQLERLPLAAACSSASDRPAPSAASASAPPPAPAPPPVPPKQRARAMCPRRSGCETRERQSDTCGAVRRRCGAEADVQVQVYTGWCGWVQMGATCVASDRRSLSVIAASYARSMATRSLGVEAAAGCAALPGCVAERRAPDLCRLGTQMVAAARRQKTYLRHR